MAELETLKLAAPTGVVAGGEQEMQTVDITVTAAGALAAAGEIGSPLVKFTALGGLAVKLYNRTGAVTVAGQTVVSDIATDDGVILCPADSEHPVGVFLDAGVADDALAWVVVSGIADVAMEDNTAAIHGYWVRNSVTEPGYADSTNADPPGGGVVNLDIHTKEIGHCIESVGAGGGGTHILARCILHFN